MAKRVQPSLRIKCWTIGCGKDHAGSSNSCADRACARDAHADGTGCLIAGTRDDATKGAVSGPIMTAYVIPGLMKAGLLTGVSVSELSDAT